MPWWAAEAEGASNLGRDPSPEVGGTVPGAEPVLVTTQTRQDPGSERVERRPAEHRDLHPTAPGTGTAAVAAEVEK